MLSFEDIFGMVPNEDSPEDRMVNDFDGIMQVVNSRWSMAEQELRALFGVGFTIDEMALYFRTDEALNMFMAKAVRSGWVVFNQAEDHVTTLPIPGQYGVLYWFLRHEELPYRLELMRITEGFSPFHGVLDMQGQLSERAVLMAHASFKTASEGEYAGAGVGLRNGDHELMMHCTSSYGRFSYYGKDPEGELPVLKPRLNLRDAGNGTNA